MWYSSDHREDGGKRLVRNVGTDLPNYTASHSHTNLKNKNVCQQRRLRVFENRVLRRTFGPKRDEVTGECRKLHKEVLNDLYYLLNIIRIIKS
jgi:hypothetical protein